MQEKNRFALQAFIICILFNGALMAVFFFMARDHFQGPDQLRNLAFVLFGGGGLATLILWLVLQFSGRLIINKSAPQVRTGEEKKPKKETPKTPSPAPAIQILSILQRQGRLIDFLEEDLSVYEDMQIGAAVRNIHEGCKKGLFENVDLKPVFDEAEGEAVTINPGFDANAVRLTGNIVGDPPFKGVLRHRGWQVARIELPQQLPGQENNKILAPAEVEINGDEANLG